MCGIAGYARALCCDAPLEDKAVLRRMAAALTHRGPDDEGFVYGNRVALGHRRLAVIDIAGGGQPMRDKARGLAIVFNGEIYNYLELNRQLESKGFRARTRSDTETILHAYAAWGEDCVNHLNGMFAFVIHDERNRTLFGARDRMGKKPLYYVSDGPFFAFASEPKALLQHPAVTREMDHEALARYFVFGHVPAPFSIYRGMRKLARAHRFTVDLETGRLTLEPYWAPPLAGTTNGLHSEAWWTRRLGEALERAVERRLIADVPLGVFLSGGIDSSAVTAAMARRLGRGNVKTFSVAFDDPQFDESKHARGLAKLLGTEHHEQLLEPETVIAALPEVTRFMDEPFADPSILPTYLLARFTRQHVTVALGGDGGDELFAGYQTFRALPAARVYNAIVPGPVHRALVRPLASRLRAGNGYFPLDFKIKRFLRGVKVPEHERLWRWLAAFEPESLSDLVTPEAMEGVAVDRLFSQLFWLNDHGDRDAIARDAHVFAATYLAEGVLTKVDRATMACSLETRSPLLDVELVELAASIPSRLKVSRGRLKHIFKATLRGTVPADLIDRPKRGFAIPLGAWFRNQLRDLLLDTLDRRALIDGGVLQPEAVQRLIDDHLAGRQDHGRPLFSLLMFESWRRQWLAGTATPPIRLAHAA